MRILVTFAVEAEFAPWRKLRRFHKASAEGVGYFSSRIGEAEITVLFTGVGGRKAWRDTADAIYDSEIDVCISSGLAGGLKPAYRAGEVVVAEKALSAARDIVALSAPALVDCAISCGATKVPFFYTADHVVLQSYEKLQLGEFADAVEMESCDVLLQSGMFAAKTVAVRAISDGVDDDIPVDFNKTTDGGGDIRIARVLGEVAGAPRSIPALIRFGRRSKLAAESLANFLERYLQVLVVESQTAPAGTVL